MKKIGITGGIGSGKNYLKVIQMKALLTIVMLCLIILVNSTEKLHNQNK